MAQQGASHTYILVVGLKKTSMKVLLGHILIFQNHDREERREAGEGIRGTFKESGIEKGSQDVAGENSVRSEQIKESKTVPNEKGILWEGKPTVE